MTSRSASDPAKAFFAVTVPTCLFSSLELQPAPALSPDVAPARFGSSYSRSEPALAENQSCAWHVAPGTVGAEESWRDGASCLCQLLPRWLPASAPEPLWPWLHSPGMCMSKAGKGWDSPGGLPALQDGVLLPLWVAFSSKLNYLRPWTCWSVSRGGHKDAQGTGAPLLWLGELAWRGEGFRETLQQPLSAQMGLRGSWRGTCYKGTS